MNQRATMAWHTKLIKIETDWNFFGFVFWNNNAAQSFRASCEVNCVVTVRQKFSSTLLSKYRPSGGLGRLAAWHLSGGPVGPPARWAATSNVERENGTEQEALSEGWKPLLG